MVGEQRWWNERDLRVSVINQGAQLSHKRVEMTDMKAMVELKSL